jgi:hypothetical protein
MFRWQLIYTLPCESSCVRIETANVRCRTTKLLVLVTNVSHNGRKENKVNKEMRQKKLYDCEIMLFYELV